MRQYNLSINNNSYEIIIKEVTEEDVTAEVNGETYVVRIQDIKDLAKASSVSPFHSTSSASLAIPSALSLPDTIGQQAAVSEESGDDDICSPMPGQIIGIYVSKGEKVLVGQKVMVLEAMKLENALTANKEGVVAQIFVKEGDIVNQNQSLMVIK